MYLFGDHFTDYKSFVKSFGSISYAHWPCKIMFNGI